MYLQDIVKGNYGRRKAEVVYTQVTPDNVLKIVNEGVKALNWNRGVIKYLDNYKKGDCPTRYRVKTIRDDINNHVVANHAWEIVQFKNAQTNAEPIQYIGLSKEDNISKAVEKLNEYARVSHKHRKDIDAGEWTSAVGTGFKAVIRTNDSTVPFKIIAPSPLNTVVVYSSATEEPLLAIQELKDEDNKTYWLCFDNKYEYRVQGGRLLPLGINNDGVAITRRLHMFADIPIVEYVNNADRISDIELVIDLLDAINNYQSNRLDSVEQMVQAFFKFVNCDIDEETFEKMKSSGALCVKSNNGENKADVDILTINLNQADVQIAKEDLWNEILSILAIPNKQGNTGGDTQGAVELRNGWDFAKSRAKIKDQYVIDAEMRLAKVMLGIIHSVKGENECAITEFDFTTQIIHNPTDNLVARVNALTQLLAGGIHPKLSMETVGLWSDTEKAYQMSKETLEKKQYSEKQEMVQVEETKIEE